METLIKDKLTQKMGYNKDMLDTIIKVELAQKVNSIDKDGYYPNSIMRNMGKANLYKIIDSFSELNSNANTNHLISQGLKNVINNLASVANTCGTTAFCAWCQDALSWYLINSNNKKLQESTLDSVLNGELLGGTGLSNPMKAYADIEKNYLSAIQTNNGYIINGTLPWVSNIEYGHIFGSIFNVKNSNHNAMGIIRCDSNKVLLKSKIKFCALNGSATQSVVLKNYFMPFSDVLADPVEPYLIKIAPGFILLQTGLAMGVIRSCIDEINKSNKNQSHINRFIEDQGCELENSLNEFCKRVWLLCETPFNSDDPIYMQELLKVRLEASKLSIRSASSACLHGGARGYLYNTTAHRNLKEAYFVAIVTPSIKHINKELEDIKNGVGVMKKWKNNTNCGDYII